LRRPHPSLLSQHDTELTTVLTRRTARHRPPYRHGIDHQQSTTRHRHRIVRHRIDCTTTTTASTSRPDTASTERRRIMSQKEIVDAVLLLRGDHRVADIWYSVETIATLLNVPTMTLNKALSKSPEFTHIDVSRSSSSNSMRWLTRDALLVDVNHRSLSSIIVRA
jgi:hypothetical protein